MKPAGPTFQENVHEQENTDSFPIRAPQTEPLPRAAASGSGREHEDGSVCFGVLLRASLSAGAPLSDCLPSSRCRHLPIQQVMTRSRLHVSEWLLSLSLFSLSSPTHLHPEFDMPPSGGFS